MNLIPRRNRREAGALAQRPETGMARFRHEVDNLFNRFLREPFGAIEELGLPRTDVVETDKEIQVNMELPGINPKDVEINVAGGLLTVRGEKKQESEQKHRDYHYLERQFGGFERSFQLPTSVDPDKVQADYKNGVLTVRLEKQPHAQAKRIPVKTG